MVAAELDKVVLAEHEFYESGNLKNLLKLNYDDSPDDLDFNWLYILGILSLMGLLIAYNKSSKRKKNDISSV